MKKTKVGDAKVGKFGKSVQKGRDPWSTCGNDEEDRDGWHEGWKVGEEVPDE